MYIVKGKYFSLVQSKGDDKSLYFLITTIIYVALI
jgi:hypothetical protein